MSNKDNTDIVKSSKKYLADRVAKIKKNAAVPEPTQEVPSLTVTPQELAAEFAGAPNATVAPEPAPAATPEPPSKPNGFDGRIPRHNSNSVRYPNSAHEAENSTVFVCEFMRYSRNCTFTPIDRSSIEAKNLASSMTAELRAMCYNPGTDYNLRKATDDLIEEILTETAHYCNTTIGAVSKQVTALLVSLGCESLSTYDDWNNKPVPLLRIIDSLYMYSWTRNAIKYHSQKPALLMDGSSRTGRQFVEAMKKLGYSDDSSGVVFTDMEFIQAHSALRCLVQNYHKNGIDYASVEKKPAEMMRAEVRKLIRFMLHSDRVGKLDIDELGFILRGALKTRTEAYEAARDQLPKIMEKLAEIDWTTSLFLFRNVGDMLHVDTTSRDHNAGNNWEETPW